MMGLEEHLLGMFRDDFEFNDAAAPSHLGSTRRPTELAKAEQAVQIVLPTNASTGAQWSPEATKELGKIPFFVRGKAKRNTERFATEQGVSTITVETLYDAKAHFSR
jgi:light-independent protochlorophyllide reductase subunit B